MDMLSKIQPELPASVEHGLCSRFRTTKSYCTSCAAVCPVPGAVQFAEQGAEIQGAEITDACVGCGACASACPNGAISLKESDPRLVERIRSRIRPGEAFRIACPRAEGKVDVVLPCLSRLTEVLLLEPIRSGAARVELLDPGCSGCGLNRAAPQWERSLFLARALCESAGFTAGRVERVQVSVGKPETREASESPNPRRAMFRAIADKWKETATVAATELEETGQQAVEPFREAVQRHHGNPKRTELLQVLRALPGAEARSKSLPAAGLPLADVEVSSQCVGCNVCETLCPVGALCHRETNGVYALDFSPALCTGCRVCEAACFYQAIRIRETVELSVLFNQPSATLISAPRQTCRSCHESFLGEVSGVCPSCRVSGDRRESIARNFFLGGTQDA
jgi:Fe-S-cluster-containing dehydrogenase component